MTQRISHRMPRILVASTILAGLAYVFVGRGTPDDTESPVVRPSQATPTSDAPASPPSRPSAHAPSTPQPTLDMPTEAASWREALADGDHARAWQIVQAAGLDHHIEQARSFEDLMALAELAERMHDPEGTVSALRRLFQTYASHPETPTAALKLGLVFLDKLDQPHAAARALRLAVIDGMPDQELETALTRLVEAHVKADELKQAEEAAARYQQYFPQGRQTRTIEEWLGH